VVDATPTSRAALNYSSPRPYHDIIPPPPLPAQEPFQHRTASTESRLSDISMDERSVFEYSDTSDDADAYFLPTESLCGSPSLLDNNNMINNRPSCNTSGRSAFQDTNHRGRTRNNTSSSGESAFRDLKQKRSKSTKIVRFSSGSATSVNNDDNHEDKDTSAISTHSTTDSLTQTMGENENKGVSLLGQFMKRVVYTFNTSVKDFNTPIGKQRNGYNIKTSSSVNKKASCHNRTESHTVTEYPYSMINLRDNSQKSALKDFNYNSPEKSPLLGRSKNRANYGVYNEGYDSTSSDYHPLRSTTQSSKTSAQSEATSLSDIGAGHDNLKINLLPGSESLASLRRQTSVIKSRSMATKIAAYFLMDYEASRIAALPSTFETITENQLTLYKTYYSWQWRYFVNLAIVLLFLSHTLDLLTTAVMHSCVIVVLAIDIQIREGMYAADPRIDAKHPDRYLVRPMVAFLFLLGLETWMWYFFSPKVGSYSKNPPLFSSFLKPMVLFYVSTKARDSLEAIWRISQIVIRVLVIEFFLILIFAAFAHGMFGNKFDDFLDLRTSWLSLFKLSTTVNNPSLWMPMYAAIPSYSIFFVVFIITCVFYYHSLVLSVVFQTYIQAVTDIHARAALDRHDAIRLAFLALLKDGQSDYISTSSVRRCLQMVRPHYNVLKMNALLEIVDPSNEHIIDYPAFRNKIRRALNSSVRTARTATPLAMCVEFIAVFVAATNFIYVTAKNLDRGKDFWVISYGYVGFVISFLGLLELTIRFNPLKIPNFAPITRLDVFFDGMALIAAFVSCYGIVQYAARDEALIESGDMIDYLYLGRAIDMVRVLRFFPIFRDIVRRSADVLPALAGPLILFLSVIHIFVYFGTVLWSGAIDVEVLMENEDLSPLYCLNNFNSYTEGLITMFNIAVVNDWHAIAEVYLYADRHSSQLIVYPFFVSAICFMVFIMINVITAFFVEAFVTKTNEPADDIYSAEEKASTLKSCFRIQNSENTNVRRVCSSDNLSTGILLEDEDADLGYDALLDQNLLVNSAASTCGTSTDTFASFDIYEREGFDNIMRTVAGATDDEQEVFARIVCNYLERFESLTSGREKVGYMVCCQQSLNRFGNRRFQTSSRSFLTDDTLHKVVSDMHSELLALTSTRKNSFGNRCLVRTFPQIDGESSRHLEIAATLLRHQPAATLFVSRIRMSKATE